MNKNNWLFQPWLYVVLIVYFALGYSTLAWGDPWAAGLYPEDHYFENVGALSLLIASLISFYIFIQALQARGTVNIHWFKLLVYLGLAGLYFFGAGEEISWGQRIFDIQEPTALSRENTQEELNIHDLKVFENSKLLKSDNIFTVFWLVFAVLIPFGSLFATRFRQFAETWVPVVYWGMGALFLINYLGAKLAKLIFVSAYTYQPISFMQAVQEIKESNYELLFVFLSLFVLWDLNSSIHQKSRSTAAS